MCSSGGCGRRSDLWALGLQSDLDDQENQTARAQQQAAQASKEVETLSGEIDQISQSVSDAGDQLSQAGDEAQQNVQTTLDGLGTKLDSMKGEAASVKDELEKAAKESKVFGRRTARRDEPAIGHVISGVSPVVMGEPVTRTRPAAR